MPTLLHRINVCLIKYPWEVRLLWPSSVSPLKKLHSNSLLHLRFKYLTFFSFQIVSLADFVNLELLVMNWIWGSNNHICWPSAYLNINNCEILGKKVEITVKLLTVREISSIYWNDRNLTQMHGGVRVTLGGLRMVVRARRDFGVQKLLWWSPTMVQFQQRLSTSFP